MASHRDIVGSRTDRTHRRHPAWSVVAAAGLVVAAGCSSEVQDGDDGAATSPGAAPTSQPAPSADMAPAVPLPPRPVLADEETPEGARAFVEYYLTLVNSLNQAPRSGVLEPLATPACAPCDSFENTVAAMEGAGLRTEGPMLSISEVHEEIGGPAEVVVEVEQLPVDVVDGDGAVHLSHPAGELTMRFQLDWQDSEWIVTTVTLAES